MGTGYELRLLGPHSPQPKPSEQSADTCLQETFERVLQKTQPSKTVPVVKHESGKPPKCPDDSRFLHAVAGVQHGRHPEPSEAASIHAPLMLHHGELDERVNASWPEFEKALRSADVSYENYDYTGANHGFHNDTTPRYDEDAAVSSWSRTTGFFAEHLDLGD